MSTITCGVISTALSFTGSALGSYTFDITQLATTSVQRGGTDAGRELNATNDVSGLLLSSAPFRSAVTAGTFTVNGKQVTVASTDTLGQVFDKIATATVGVVTASYDPGTDKLTLSSAGTILLGSAADTSNFLQIAKLENEGDNEVSGHILQCHAQVAGGLVGQLKAIVDGVVAGDHAGRRAVNAGQDIGQRVGGGIESNGHAVDLELPGPAAAIRNGGG